VFKADGKDYGTKTLNRHRIRCSKTKQTDVVQVMMDLQGKLETHAIDKKKCLDKCVLLQLLHMIWLISLLNFKILGIS
jgi:hypothetical protein